ncbi:MAG TPA: diacylglycerol kinase family protein [Blastocatellia bacterium]|nr:diacylglycerol kinase family protein [Blastocatellia bacterium]
MRVTLIHNPTAGDESFSASELTALIERAGHQVLYRSSKKDYKSALRLPADLVAIAGGDGTVHKVAMELLGRHTPLAVLPCGTANNIAKSLGIEGSPQALIAGWPSARQQGFDVGVARGPKGESRFLEGVGLGLFSGLMSILGEIDDEYDIDFDDPEQKLHSDIKALEALVAEYPPCEVEVIIDEQRLTGKYVLIEAMNIKSVGPNLQFAPEADPGDGLLDFVFVTDDERAAMLDYLRRRRRSSEAWPRLTVHRGRHIRVAWQGAEVHLDDKIWLDKEDHQEAASESPHAPVIDVTVERNALRFLVRR